MDLPRWEQDLQADLAIIEDLLAEMRKVTPSDDAKLQHLKTTILSKLASPINAGIRKVLIFTAFADTADYLYEHLAPFFWTNQHLHTGKVTGCDSPKDSTLTKSYDFQSLLTLFSPALQGESRHPAQENPGRLTSSLARTASPRGRTFRTAITSSTTTSTGTPSASSSGSGVLTASARRTSASSW